METKKKKTASKPADTLARLAHSICEIRADLINAEGTAARVEAIKMMVAGLRGEIDCLRADIARLKAKLAESKFDAEDYVSRADLARATRETLENAESDSRDIARETLREYQARNFHSDLVAAGALALAVVAFFITIFAR